MSNQEPKYLKGKSIYDAEAEDWNDLQRYARDYPNYRLSEPEKAEVNLLGLVAFLVPVISIGALFLTFFFL